MAHSEARARAMAIGESLPPVTYLDIEMTGTKPVTRFTALPAQQFVTRSGSIVGSVGDYYCAVSRLSMEIDIPIVVCPIGTDFAADGISTAWTMTVRFTDAAGVQKFGTAAIKLQLPVSKRILGQTTQPADFYAAIWTLSEWRDALTQAAVEAYAACNVAAGGVLPTDTPFFSLSTPGSGRLQVTVNPFSYWDQATQAPGAPFLELFINAEAEPAFGGWDIFQETDDNAVLNPNGCDFKFLIRSDGTNYSPLNAPGQESLTPTAAPADVSLIIQQTSPCYSLPGVTRISILSSIPSNPELVPSAITSISASTDLVLQDFAPDIRAVLGDNKSRFIYNAGLGEARWMKLIGSQSLSTFHVRFTTKDWLGTQRDFVLNNQSETVSMKLVFIPNECLESRGVE